MQRLRTYFAPYLLHLVGFALAILLLAFGIAVFSLDQLSPTEARQAQLRIATTAIIGLCAVAFVLVAGAGYLMQHEAILRKSAQDSLQKANESLAVVNQERSASEDRLRRLIDLSESIINSLPGVFYLYDETGKFMRWNRNFEAVTGYTAAEMETLHPLDFFAGEEKKILAERIEGVFHTGYGEVEADFVSKFGQRTPYYFNGVRAEIDGKPCLIGMGVDITARKRAEEALQRSEAHLRLALKAANMGAWSWDIAAHQTTYSAELGPLFGLPAGAGTTSRDVFLGSIYFEDRGPFDAAVRRVLENGAPYAMDYRVVRPDCSIHWLASRGQLQRDAAGKPIKVVGICMDITEHKRAESALRESEKRANALLENSAVIAWAKDAEGRHIYLSRNFEKRFGVRFDDWRGKTDFDFWPRETAQRFRDNDSVVLRENRTIEIVEEVRNSDGSYSSWLTCKFPYQDSLGNKCVGGLGVEITERKRAEAALRESEERLRLALDAARMGTFDWDVPHNRITWSRRHEELWGLPPGGFAGTYEAFSEGVHHEDLPVINAETARCMAAREPIAREFRVVWPDGSVHWVSGRGEFTFDAAGQPMRMRGVTMEVTKHKLAEQALNESNERLRGILDGVFAFVGLLSLDGTILEVNRAPLEAAGLRREDVIDKPLVESYWFADLPAVQAEILDALAKASRGEIVRFDTQGRIASNRLISVDFMLAPLRDARGNIVQVVGSAVDITARKQTEEALHVRNDLYAMISHTNRAVSRSRSRDELFPEICAIAVETGRFRFAWIGVPDGNRVKMVASAGADDGYMADVVISLDKDDPRSHGPVGRAALTGQPLVVNDIMSSPIMKPWHELAKRVGFQAVAAFPLKEGEKVVAVLALYASVPGFFTEELVTTLSEITPSVSFALDAFVQERERGRFEAERDELYKQVLISRQKLQALSHRLLQTQEDERRRLARELHDEIGQVLTAVRMNLSTLKALGSEPKMLQDSLTIVDRAIGQVRTMSLDLRPAMLDDLGLTPALRWYLDHQAQRGGFTARLLADALLAPLPGDLATVCFRVVQEAVNNILRYAHATHVQVELRQCDGSLAMTVRDDGVGFDVTAARRKARAGTSLGLLGMEERVTLAGGQFNVQSAPDRGTEISFRFPFKF